jgi:hypothetical protein
VFSSILLIERAPVKLGFKLIVVTSSAAVYKTSALLLPIKTSTCLPAITRAKQSFLLVYGLLKKFEWMTFSLTAFVRFETAKHSFASHLFACSPLVSKAGTTFF